VSERAQAAENEPAQRRRTAATSVNQTSKIDLHQYNQRRDHVSTLEGNKRRAMVRVAPFHSINESRKGAPRYHTNDQCERALVIPPDDLRPGSGGFYLCETCRDMREQEEFEYAQTVQDLQIEEIEVVEETTATTSETEGKL
jgi:hypothetical protein